MYYRSQEGLPLAVQLGCYFHKAKKCFTGPKP